MTDSLNKEVSPIRKNTVSVIIPVYNVEAYIRRCIESLKAQKLDGLEFIFVDDCSTDDSMAPVEAWAAEDKRVRILRNEENLGAGPSRNRGIETARGEYLSFIDPDDYVSLDFYELLYYSVIKNGGHDIVKGMRKNVDEASGNEEPVDQCLYKRITTQLRTGRPLYELFTYEHQTALYRHTLFFDNTVRYGTSRNGQDTTFLLRCCYTTNDIVLEQRAIYYYVLREGSAIHRDGLTRSFNEIDSLTEKVEFFRDKDIDTFCRQYLYNQAHTVIERFQELYYSGYLDSKDYDAISDYLVAVIEKYKLLHFLQHESPVYKALIDHGKMLPIVECISDESKVSGTLEWMTFIENTSNEDSLFIDGCANIFVNELIHLKKKKGKEGFWQPTRI